jgi:hypothetical protein
MCVGPEKNY